MGGRAPAWLLPVLVAAVAAAVYLAVDPESADLAAQRFRIDLFEREGFTLFSTAWYGGHHTPGYSILFPPLGALLGAQFIAAVAAVVSTGFVAAIGGRLAGLVFVPGVIGSLVSGRLAFTFGFALATGAVFAAVRARVRLAALGGVLAALASPVAALFAALAGAALWLAGRSRAAATALVLATAVPTGLLILAFPEGGVFPFVFSAFWPALLAGAALAAWGPREWPALRIAGGLYALLALAAYLVDTPLGGNTARLGTLLAPPVAAIVLWPRHKAILALLALPLAYWALQPAVRDWLRTHDDPSTERAFHQPLLDEVEQHQPARVEIPFTQSHGEAFHVARRVPIARGWLRQLDVDRNALFYEGHLTPEAYATWLRENAIGYVAVPLGLPMDASAEEEKTLALSDPESLEEVWRNENWRLYEVTDPTPLADGVAAMQELKPEGFVLRARTAGIATVRVRFTPYWSILEGEGCVGPAPGGWTRVEIRRPGLVEVGTRFALDRVRTEGQRCT